MIISVINMSEGGVSDPVGNTNTASTSTDNTAQFGRSTSTSVNCTPAQVAQGGSTTCTAAPAISCGSWVRA